MFSYLQEIDLDADITQMQKMIADTQVERKEQFMSWNNARENCDMMREIQRDLEEDVIRQSRMIQLSLEVFPAIHLSVLGFGSE